MSEPGGWWVEATRGGVVESRHTVHVAVVDARGELRAFAGDPERLTFMRSAAKPFQALPLVDDGVAERFGLSAEELALCCGSHSGSAAHTSAVERLLQRAGLGTDALACGPMLPWDEAAERALEEAGLEPGRVHHNCSGKHAGMLLLARSHGWPTAGYQHPAHPVQQRLLAEISRWAGLPAEAIPCGTDGCGVVCYALPLRRMAYAFARLAAAARAGERAPAAVLAAMSDHPLMVAGEGRLCTLLMRQARGRLVAKTGAEGVYCVAVPGAELGIALKVEDGAARAQAPAILGVLRELDLISEDDLGALHALAWPELLNSRGERVGELRPGGALQVADG